MKKFHQVLAVLFTAFILVFIALFILIPEKDYSTSEKRNLSHMPKVSSDTVLDGSFMSDMEDYLLDQFPFRDFFMKMKVNALSFIRIKESHGVYQMINGALCERFEKPDAVNKKETIDSMKAFSERFTDVNQYFLLSPNAVSVYPEKLPYGAVTESEKAYISDFYTSLHEDMNCIDVSNVFSENKNTPIFYKTDHHWTSFGAYISYLTLKNEMGLTEEVSFTPSVISNNFYGSLTSESGFSVKVPDTIEVYLPEEEVLYTVTYVSEAKRTATCFDTSALNGDNPYEVFFGGNHPLLVIDTEVDTDRNLLVIKDSYANALLPFLIPHFQSITVIDPRYYYEDIDQLMLSRDFTDVLFLYNVNTLSKDTVLKTVLKNEQ